MTWSVPVQFSIHGDSVKLSEEFRQYIERRLRFALGRFASAIQRVKVRTEDINGPRGGIDKRCHVEVQLRASRSSPILVTSDDSTLQAAVDCSAKRAARNVARKLDRRFDRSPQRKSTRAHDDLLESEEASSANIS